MRLALKAGGTSRLSSLGKGRRRSFSTNYGKGLKTGMTFSIMSWPPYNAFGNPTTIVGNE
ncbi:hypothetical protein N7471_009248 [Penicillium samsonianum]|uniref:uncharacterized protein n=1 Tax=Penicillium samsonianum TaxID=1882272 RepID=UPI002546C43D|nr:uncharacterized protein N7471_009248 [Penicillium samsonianum]KAJ6128031.1 hypothetical protein N7471_009248 [Penicillium samsonianum]